MKILKYLNSDYWRLKRSILFDRNYYLLHNPDVKAAGLDPILHYLSSGAREGRNPHWLFNSTYYLEQNLDVKNSTVNPLIHFLLFGALEGRNPHPVFSSSYYFEQNPDVRNAKFNPLIHFLKFGYKEGRNPHVLFNLSHYSTGPSKAGIEINPLEHFLTTRGAPQSSTHPLFDCAYYLGTNADVKAADMNPLLHFLSSEIQHARNPNPVFSTQFYLKQYPDVASSGMNPLEHFIRVGASQMRRPSELFDTRFYCNQNPEACADGRNPLEHYLSVGISEKRWPNELFSPEYYLSTYKDVANSDANILEHYTANGAAEGRNPNPYFDTNFYLNANPDVKAMGVHPLAHFLDSGAKELRSPSSNFNTYYYWIMNPDIRNCGLTPLGHFLLHGKNEGRAPVPHGKWEVSSFSKPISQMDLPLGNKVLVIIPVYSGFQITKDCLVSALAARNNCPHEFLIIYDCGPEEELKKYIQSLEDHDRVKVIYNSENLGFVKSVNLGMQFDLKTDVVLLNSDTLVNNYWLDRMYLQAHSLEKVGSVTPFSNNATICSYPTMSGISHLPEGESLEFLDSICSHVNAGRSVPIPTAVGFCMYIPRKCLNEVGFFDEANFGKGYGEENDFCMRATAKGYLHLFALDTFVFHTGNVSFGSSSDVRKREAGQTMLRLHPHYDRLVQAYCQADLGRTSRNNITAGRYKNSGKQVCLIITHALGGGTEKHISELVTALKEEMKFVFLRPVAEPGRGQFVRLSTGDGYDNYHEDFAESDFYNLVAAIESFGVSRAHIHHTMSFQISLRKLIRTLGVAFDFSVHDYFSVCPFVTLTTATGAYCGEPGPLDCNRCIASRIKDHPVDILNWRENSRWLFEESERVIAPSQDVMTRIKRYFGDAKVFVVPHDALTQPLIVAPVKIAKIRVDEPLKILMIGTMVTHKGSQVVKEVLTRTRELGFNLKFHLIGGWDQSEKTPDDLTLTGPYQENEFSKHFDAFSPDLVWFAGQCPETYSYTLNLALERGLPIVAPRIGSFPARIGTRLGTWFLEVNPEATQVARLFNELREKCFLTGEFFAILGHSTSVPTQLALDLDRAFYKREYLEPLPPRKIMDVRRKGRFTGSIVCETNSHAAHPVPTACGYIRLVLPYTRGLEEIRMHTFLLPADMVQFYITDFMVTQRLALGHPGQVNTNLNHLQRYSIRLIYDLDDDLLGIGTSHSEYDHYFKLLPSITRQALEADLITVSTEVLAKKMRLFNPNVELITNSHDDRIFDENPGRTPAENKLKILYMGTPTHTQDLLLIKDPLEKIAKEFKDQVEVVIIGGTNNPELFPNFKMIKPPDSAAGSYPQFVRWIESQGPFDIGLSPLVENGFNIGKSGLKYMDYSALGLATICSQVKAYEGIVEHGKNGMIIPNEPEIWEATLRELILDRSKLETIRVAAHQNYLIHHIFNSKTSEPARAIGKVVRTLAATKKAAMINRSMAESPQWKSRQKSTSSLKELVEASYSPGLVYHVGSESGLSADNLISSLHFERMMRLHSDSSLSGYNEKTLIIDNLFLENENPIQVFLDLFDASFEHDFVILRNDYNQQDRFGVMANTDLQHLILDYTIGPAVSRLDHYRHWLAAQNPQHTVVDTAQVLELYQSNKVKHFHRIDRGLIHEFFTYCRSIGLRFEIKVHLSSENQDLFVLQKEQTRLAFSRVQFSQPPLLNNEVLV